MEINQVLNKSINNKIKVLLLSDIFGSKYLCSELLDKLNSLFSLTIIDPYQNEKITFLDEKEAYDTFLLKCGHEKYFNIVKNYCLNNKVDIILGFSVGANVAWRISALDLNIKQSICFYPSQIRNYLHLKPMFVNNIVFAQKESTFDVFEIERKLMQDKKIFVQISNYEHGFMNFKSKNYSKEAFFKYLNFVVEKIQNSCTF